MVVASSSSPWPRDGRGKRRARTGRSRRSPSAAVAGGARPLAGARPREGVVAPFSGDRVGPPRTRPWTTMPPPVPVPRITPKTTAAPSPRRRSPRRARSSSRRSRSGAAVEEALEILAGGRPLSQTLFAFFTRPVAARAPGIRCPPRGLPLSRRAPRPAGDRGQRRLVAAARRLHAPSPRSRPLRSSATASISCRRGRRRFAFRPEAIPSTGRGADPVVLASATLAEAMVVASTASFARSLPGTAT